MRVLSSYVLTFIIACATAHAQEATIYDERDVPDYTLPDPLITADGAPVQDARTWYDVRRPELLTLFEEHVYGRTPETIPEIRYDVTSEDAAVFGGRATRRQVSVYFQPGSERPRMDLLIYVPNDRSGPVPAFLGLNFFGNQTVYPDAGIHLTDQWMRSASGFGIEENRATEVSRGVRTGRWPVERILDRGYALVTVYYGDLFPDRDDGFPDAVHALYDEENPSRRHADEWGAVGAWAWGLSRALDYLETDADVDAHRVAVMGHSRLGKAALWAGARDERFALVISNNSGCGGAALSMRRFGETVERINTSFPHWFAENFRRYNGSENALPVDQHMLLALVAPRPVYVASASEDLWADPRGEFLAAHHAGPVYELLGAAPMPVTEMPALNEPAMATIGYHIRPGPHDVTNYDWERFLDFADLHLASK